MADETVLREIHALYKKFEWQITNFFSLSRDEGFYILSPSFFLMDVEWYIVMYPNEMTLFLERKSNTSYGLRYRIGIKNSDGSIQRWFIPHCDTNHGCIWKTSVDRAELMDSKDTLVPDGNLTLVVNIRFKDHAVESSSQTSAFTDSTETLVKNFEDMLLRGDDADVTIKIHGREFQAHRAILKARSSVFYSMFQHDMAEKNSGLLEIQDCDSESFGDFLLFVYTGKTDHVASGNACGLYQTADKYDLQELKRECLKCMNSDMSMDSFCDVILIAVVHEESQLLESATDFFLQNAKNIALTEQWKRFLVEHHTIANELIIKLADSKK